LYEKLYKRYIEVKDGIDYESISFVPMRCIYPDLHKNGDVHTSAGFDPATGVFSCLGCGKSLSPSNFLATIADIEVDEARRLIDEFKDEFNLYENTDTYTAKRPQYNKHFDELAKKSRELMNPDLEIIKEFCEFKNLKYETLVNMGVGYLPAHNTHWKRDSIVYTYTFGNTVIGIRYRDINGNKGGEPGCFLTLWGIDELDEQDIVILVEGESDRLVVAQALNFKYTVVSAPTADFKELWAREFFDINQVIVIPDLDERGQQMVTKARKYLRDKVSVINLPFGKREFGKDIGDWLINRSEEDFRNLVKVSKIRGHRKPMDGNLLEEVASQQQQWFIDNFIAKSQTAVIAGAPKSMKTWLSLNIIECLLTPGMELFDLEGIKSNEVVPMIGYIQEEGNAEELLTRAQATFRYVDNWKDRIIWFHRMGVKLDQIEWFNKISEWITKYKLNIIFIDPFQRIHSQDENDSTGIGKVWSNIDNLLNIHPDLAIVILHHFRKSGDLSEGWNAFRGSSRIAAEADLGVFVEKRPKSEVDGIKMRIDGRSINAIEDSNGSDIIRLAFSNGIFKADRRKVTTSKRAAIEQEVALAGGAFPLLELCMKFGVDPKLMKRWIGTSQLVELDAEKKNVVFKEHIDTNVLKEIAPGTIRKTVIPERLREDTLQDD
jgi:5S rRNA maturation endonuclease (ribonuclease M5)